MHTLLGQLKPPRCAVRPLLLWRCWALLVAVLLIAPAAAADLQEARQAFREGRYKQALQLAEQAIEADRYEEDWRLLKIDVELTLGRYEQARQTLERALRKYPSAVRLRLLGHQVYRYNNEPRQARLMLQSIQDLARRTPFRFSDAANQVALGRFFLLQGADARQVLESLYDPVKQAHPTMVEVHLAIAQLALDKQDYALAAESLQPALELAPDDPEIHYLLAQCYIVSDLKRAEAALQEALEQNPQHIPSLLLKADALIDSERYADARQILDQVLEINAHQPEAWAYQAAIAHLTGKADEELESRQRARKWWTDNPNTDHLIGRKLSRHYRFAEGAEYQRQALKMDPNFLPAKMQLSQDLLRLGDPEGWELAAEVNTLDGYNVVAHNLMLLRDSLQKFRTLEQDGFVVRMEAREAQLYGQRVLDLLGRARQELCQKYDVQLEVPIIVEIFPDQQDFAIRTFGLPGGDGFLGVCFGHVITANSPASQADHPTNWESVLWHEFCHVVTLEKTRNKMPRWLSEGISVYEEVQQDARWGQSMTPQYREMILEGELTPVSKLSDAFLHPPSPLHLQFAYYESALVVEYLISTYSVETLQRVLEDLGVGMAINESLARYVGSMEQLDAEFERFALQRAREYGEGVDWEPAEVPPNAELSVWSNWVAEHPTNVDGLHKYALQLLKHQRYEEAQEVLEKLLRLHPGGGGNGQAYALLAEVHRKQGDTSAERAVLEQWAEQSADAVPAYLRLMELGAAHEDWSTVARYAQQMLCVNPLLPAPHQYLARASRHVDDVATSINSYEALLSLNPLDPVQAHYELAELLNEQGHLSRARRHVLQALEEAPRYRKAHDLLLEIANQTEDGTPPSHAQEE